MSYPQNDTGAKLAPRYNTGMTEFTRDFFVKKGREGGNATYKKLGKKGMKKNALKAVAVRRKKKLLKTKTKA